MKNNENKENEGIIPEKTLERMVNREKVLIDQVISMSDNNPPSRESVLIALIKRNKLSIGERVLELAIVIGRCHEADRSYHTVIRDLRFETLPFSNGSKDMEALKCLFPYFDTNILNSISEEDLLGEDIIIKNNKRIALRDIPVKTNLFHSINEIQRAMPKAMAIYRAYILTGN